MRKYTINPLTIKAGDQVFMAVLKQNFNASPNEKSAFKFLMSVCRFYVAEIHQTVSPVDSKLNKRNFLFILLSDPGTSIGPEQIKLRVDEQAPMFKTVKDCQEWIHKEVDSRVASAEGHESRQEDYQEFKLLPKQTV